MRKLLSLTLIFLVVLPALAKDDEANIRAAVEDRYKEWIAAANKKDAAALTNLYDENAVLMPKEEEPVIGKALLRFAVNTKTKSAPCWGEQDDKASVAAIHRALDCIKLQSRSARNQEPSSRGALNSRLTSADSKAPVGSGDRVKRLSSTGPAPPSFFSPAEDALKRRVT